MCARLQGAGLVAQEEGFRFPAVGCHADRTTRSSSRPAEVLVADPLTVGDVVEPAPRGQLGDGSAEDVLGEDEAHRVVVERDAELPEFIQEVTKCGVGERVGVGAVGVLHDREVEIEECSSHGDSCVQSDSGEIESTPLFLMCQSML
ncbi:hypothetical protein COV05_01235 [Candidatus Uhrbacteria bacterium CG10_big_fil_rev_8_21_14_0_10_48_16]|uniref:Uncharacterized protein n=1 Tax=Candidatus Uhrbacteria bacterium CG10_big_fil_rev_8_21_14_0_10_48_16 TaxID=1975038 RepID=A0A2M8LHZ2_9BACT|nr:MAG: hypothetical protein COV05_01235 [Candidatus Uhrbacteria bacterium CG10_big_fil_rev_8_21_14_0_10_48_16]